MANTKPDPSSGVCLCIKDCPVYSCGSFFQDESHFLKNIKTARCRAAVPILKVSVALRDSGA